MTIDSGNLVEISALVIYLVLLLVIGLGSITKSRTAIDYTLAGRNIPWYIALATTAATMVGGGLSIVDITATLFGSIMKYDGNNPKWEKRDRYILSKGHGCLALRFLDSSSHAAAHLGSIHPLAAR